MNDRIVNRIIMGIGFLGFVSFSYLAYSGKARFDDAQLSELRRQIHEQEIYNDNLRYQLRQCQILYKGM